MTLVKKYPINHGMENLTQVYVAFTCTLIVDSHEQVTKFPVSTAIDFMKVAQRTFPSASISS